MTSEGMSRPRRVHDFRAQLLGEDGQLRLQVHDAGVLEQLPNRPAGSRVLLHDLVQLHVVGETSLSDDDQQTEKN